MSTFLTWLALPNQNDGLIPVYYLWHLQSVDGVDYKDVKSRLQSHEVVVGHDGEHDGDGPREGRLDFELVALRSQLGTGRKRRERERERESERRKG